MLSRSFLVPRFMGVLLALAGCSDGDLLTLGEQREPVQMVSEFTQVQKVEFSSSDVRDENPTLTSDMLEIYFNSPNREGGAMHHEIWWARRDSVDDHFEPPERLPDWRDTGSDISPAISSDGLTLWVAYRVSEEDEATTDIWSVRRQSLEGAVWDELEELDELNSDWEERPRPLGWYARIMPMSRRIDTPDGPLWQTLLATRNDDGSFQEGPLLLDQIDEPDVGVVDGFLSQNGLTLVFKREAPDEDGDLFWSKRRDVSEPFRGAEPLPGPDINTDRDERDPWLSPDERTLYFVSNRDGGELNIYRAIWDTRPVDDAEAAP